MIFARRSIQRFINHLSETLPRSAITKLVRSLNKNDRTSLDFEWEVAVLFALSQIGKIRYEASHGGRCSPDVTFQLPGQDLVFFIADIATVSDRGLEDENPVRMLSKFLHEKAKKLDLSGGFDYRVEGAALGEQYGNRKIKLAMPTRKKLRAFFEANITPRLQKIKQSTDDEIDLSITEEPYKIFIRYRRDATTSSGSHLSYTAAYSLTRNPLYTSLKGKTKQLSETGFDGCKGIILCDGSCDLMRTRHTGMMNYTKQDIIHNFLRQNSSISFVLAFWVEQPLTGVFDRPKDRQVLGELFINPIARVPLCNQIARNLTRIPNLLPIPTTEAYSAVLKIEAGMYGVGDSQYGGSEVSYDWGPQTIRISSRALLRLLSDQVSPTQFAKDHWSRPRHTEDHIDNPFQQALALGLAIESITVEHQEDKDDDLLTFKLSGPDVAVKPFRRP